MTHRLSMFFVTMFLLFSTAQAQQASGHKVGNLAPRFELKSLQGQQVSLAQLTGKGYVMLVFWATECVYCYAHLSDYKQLHKDYSSRGLTVAAINIAGEYDVEVKQYVEDNEVNYLVLSDRLNNLDVAEAYQVMGTPTLVLVSPKGKIVFRGHQVPDMSQWISAQ